MLVSGVYIFGWSSSQKTNQRNCRSKSGSLPSKRWIPPCHFPRGKFTHFQKSWWKAKCFVKLVLKVLKIYIYITSSLKFLTCFFSPKSPPNSSKFLAPKSTTQASWDKNKENERSEARTIAKKKRNCTSAKSGLTKTILGPPVIFKKKNTQELPPKRFQTMCGQNLFPWPCVWVFPLGTKTTSWHINPGKKTSYFPLYWMVNRDPYNWVV